MPIKKETILLTLTATIFVVAILGMWYTIDTTHAITILSPSQGGTGFSTTTVANVGNNLFVSTTTASGIITYGFQASGGGGSLATSTSGSYALGNIAFFLSTSTLSASSGLQFVSSTGAFTLLGTLALGTSTNVSGALFTIASSSNILTVLANGNVGIGTTGPSGLLEIQSNNTGYQRFIRLTSTGATGGTQNGIEWYNTNPGTVSGAIYTQPGSGYITQVISFDVGGVGSRIVDMSKTGMAIMGAGNLAKSALDVVGGVSVGSYATVTAAPTNGMIISGNVGIGTSTPATKLDVNGDITDENVRNCNGATNAVGTDVNGKLQCDAGISDSRVKKDITPLPDTLGLSFINALNPVSYSWLDPDHIYGREHGQQLGLVAQDLLSTYPFMVTNSSIVLTSTSTLSIPSSTPFTIHIPTSTRTIYSVTSTSVFSTSTMTFNEVTSTVTSSEIFTPHVIDKLYTGGLQVATGTEATINAGTNNNLLSEQPISQTSSSIDYATYHQTTAYAVNYNSLFAPIIKSIQQLSASVNKLQSSTVSGVNTNDTVTNLPYCMKVSNGLVIASSGVCK